MEKIESFKINHLKLKRGIYVSRYDTIGNETITTFDIRFKTPYKEDALSPAVSHSIEHLAATFLRNNIRKKEVIYFGPMGCLTGFYLIMTGKQKPMDIKWLFFRMLSWIINFEGQIPGATKLECGNYKLNDLQGAKEEAKTFLNEVVMVLNDLNTNYPE